MSLTIKPFFMKKTFFLIAFALMSTCMKATIWYASTTGNGNGSFASPFNLQTALTNSPAIILAGDTLYLRGGTYNASGTRFNSNLAGTSCSPITVMSYPGEWAILNGNILPSTNATVTATLRVNGAYVIYRDFEVKYNNLVSRNDSSSNYVYCGGIDHPGGVNCKFINLVIHDNPGTGFWSSKSTGGTEIYGCLIYNNGWYTNTTALHRGRGPGIYTQNDTEDMRILKNNIVFNNFYNGFEVWSGSTNEPEIVKNYVIDDNTNFNNGSPYSNDGGATDLGANNILVATENNQTNGNYPRNISVINNVLYHNTLFTDATLNGEARPLKIGHPDSETHDLIIDNNFLCGRNPGLELNTSYNLTFTNNTVLSKYVYVAKKNYDLNLINDTNFYFDYNKYYTRRSSPGLDFRLVGHQDYLLSNWQSLFNIDLNSTRYDWRLNLNATTDNPALFKVTRNEYNQNLYKVVLFKYDPANPNVTIDFTNYGIPSGTTYTIKDVESNPATYTTGTYTGAPISFNLDLTTPTFNKPATTADFPTCYSTRTPNNFGVFLIEFAPYLNANDRVYTSNIQTDGKIIIGGDFTKYNTTAVTRIARLNSDLKPDTAFATATGAGANNRVNASLIHTGGKIVIAGKFTTYNGTTRNRIARLNTSGTNDATFTIGTGVGIGNNPDGGVFALAMQSDGKILIGGSFISYNGTTRIGIARLNTNGTLDTTFTSGFAASVTGQDIFNPYVNSIAIQADGKIVVGGGFGVYGGVNTSDIVRLNSNGTIDTTFAIGSGFDDVVESIKIQPDGKILVGGEFQNFNGTLRRFICRLLSNGSNDTTFTPDPITKTVEGSGVKVISLQTDGKIVIGGGFNVVGSTTSRCIARLSSTGILDSSFNTDTGFGPMNARPRCPGNPNTFVKTISIQTDGKFVCGGNFKSYIDNPVNNLARIIPTGTVSTIGKMSQSKDTEINTINNDVSISISPNPFSIYFTINSDKGLIYDSIEIYDTTGKLILTQKISSSDEKVLMDGYNSGLYHYKIYNKDLLLKSGTIIKQ